MTRCLAAGLPAQWVTADEAYGQEWKFRRLLEELGVGYVVAVSKSQQVKSLAGFWRIDELIAQAPDDAWQRLSCGDGAKGRRVYDWASARLPSIGFFDADEPTHRRWVLSSRSLTPARRDRLLLRLCACDLHGCRSCEVAGTRWAIEECFQAAKNECGLDEYEVRLSGLVSAHHAGHARPRLPRRPRCGRGCKGGSRNDPTCSIAALTLAEIRRLLEHLLPHHRTGRRRPREHALNWSHWRRRRQATAQRSHYLR